MPPSPYLFVLCMECLGNHMHSAITSRVWSPIKLSQSGSVLSHLVFSDDLVIFSKVDIKRYTVLKDILSRFCNFLGHHVNARKNIFFSKGVNETLSNQIRRILGYQQVSKLGKYPRIPVFHKRVTSFRVQFVVEKARAKL